MPIHWKILSKNFLLNIVFFIFFFISISVFFKLSRLTKYFVLGIDLSDLVLLLSIFLYKCFPVAIAISSFISAYISVVNIKNSNQINAFSSLGLNPSKLFTPLLFISSFLCIINLTINLILFPQIHNKLSVDLNKKKNKENFLNSFSKKHQANDSYINLTNNNDQKLSDNFFLVEAKKNLSWLMCEKVEENNNNIELTNASIFNIIEEDEGYNTIALSENSSVIIDKNSIFSTLPYATLRLEPLDFSSEKILSIILFSFFPIIFTMLGITLSLNFKNIASIAMFIFFTSFLIISSFISSSLINSVFIVSFITLIPLYSIVVYRFKRSVR